MQGWLCALAMVLAPCSVSAQSTMERSANLSGGWAGDRGVAHFNFVHRFRVTEAPQRKVTSSPTFLIAYSPFAHVLAGANYATQSLVADAYPNEWELFGRWGILRMADGAPLDGAVQVEYNNAAASVDGAVDVGRTFGRLRVLGSIRAFSSAYGGDAAAALGSGFVLRVGSIALAADAGRVTDGGDAFWSAAVQWRIPASPHSVSFHASNANTATLQGSSRGAGGTLYGFEFTVPLTISRYGRGAGDGESTAGPAAVMPAPGPAFDTGTRASDNAPPRDTVVIRIRNLAFSDAAIEVTAGTLVRWINEDPLDHTVTSVDRVWDSGAVRPAATYQRVFDRAGAFDYTCTPHPFMKGRVTVTARAPGPP